MTTTETLPEPDEWEQAEMDQWKREAMEDDAPDAYEMQQREDRSYSNRS